MVRRSHGSDLRAELCWLQSTVGLKSERREKLKRYHCKSKWRLLGLMKDRKGVFLIQTKEWPLWLGRAGWKTNIHTLPRRQLDWPTAQIYT